MMCCRTDLCQRAENWQMSLSLDLPIIIRICRRGSSLGYDKDAWNNSELKKVSQHLQMWVSWRQYAGWTSVRTGTLWRGGGCMTFLRKHWLDNMDWTFFHWRMKKLSGNVGCFQQRWSEWRRYHGNTIGVSTSRIVKYLLYQLSAEFYQDAYPSFYQGRGWRMERWIYRDSMKEAIKNYRMLTAKVISIKSPDECDCNNCCAKFMEGEFQGICLPGQADGLIGCRMDGCEWTGQRTEHLCRLSQRLENTGRRCAPVYAITSSCKNPEKAYSNIFWKAFLIVSNEVLWI